MSGQDRTAADGDRTASGHGLTVLEAARALGLSVEAVRKRLQRGQLRGERRGNRRLVYLDGAPPAGTAGQDAVPVRSGQERTAEPPRDRELVAQLQSENTYLRQALEREQVAHGETRRLMQQQLAGLLSAPAQPVTTGPTMDATPAAGTSTTTNTPRRVGWRFWRRR